MSKFTLRDYKGVIPANITIFDKNEEVDVKNTELFTDFLIKKGVGGMYLTGSTGEGFLMNEKERNTVVETVVKTVDGRVPVVVHVGDIGTKKSIDLAKFAEKAGADAISSVPPFYWRFSEENIFNYYRDLSSSVGIPMIVYNVPLAGMMSNDLIYRLSTIPNVKGLKFTGREHDDMCEIKKTLGEDFMVYSGCDEMATSGILAGADGIIGSFYNLMPEAFLAIWENAKKGDYTTAIKIQEIACKFIHFTVKFNFVPIMRECLKIMGVDGGYSRRPFIMPSKEIMDKVMDFSRKLKAQYGKTYIDFIDSFC